MANKERNNLFIYLLWEPKVKKNKNFIYSNRIINEQFVDFGHPIKSF